MGLLRYQLPNDTEKSPDYVLTVWAYEANRLFRDRIVGDDSKSKFDGILSSVIRSDWSSNVMDKLDGKMAGTFNKIQRSQ